MIPIKKYKTISTFDTSKQERECLKMISHKEIFIECDDHFCICLWLEVISFLDEFWFEFAIIFYNSIMNNNKASILWGMRMAVRLCDSSMSCPACMSNPCMVWGKIICIRLDLESAHFPNGADDFDFFLMVDDTNASRIISSIFKPLKSRKDFFMSTSCTTKVSKYSTHKQES